MDYFIDYSDSLLVLIFKLSHFYNDTTNTGNYVTENSRHQVGDYCHKHLFRISYWNYVSISYGHRGNCCKIEGVDIFCLPISIFNMLGVLPSGFITVLFFYYCDVMKDAGTKV